MNLRFASIIDWDDKAYAGRVASVVYLAGCPLRCPWCYSGALVTAPGEVSAEKPVDFFYNHLLKQRDKTRAVVFTGGEPCEQGNALAELCARLRAAGFAIKIETSGYYPEALAALIPHADFVALDVKTRLSQEAQSDYAVACGFNGNAELLVSNVLRSVAFLETRGAQYGVEWEARTTIVPGVNDDEALVREIARATKNAGSHALQAFEASGRELVDSSYATRPETTRERLFELAQAVKSELNELKQGEDARVLIRVKGVEAKV
jgi:pyruvate formate lyase activating enzyme